ncbi:MAG: exodeoxyribonuclease VII small subunit [Firmicutes bacterium]|nr:exodeoxyribonuclease VII small subunit [Bacillota bacterium]
MEKLNLEDALQKLEKIVEQMEGEELPLEKLLQHLEEGMKLTQYCRKLLSEAEFKVDRLLQNNEQISWDDLQM